MQIINTQQNNIEEVINLIQSVRSKKEDVKSVVLPIMEQVRRDGDKALFSLTEKFDGVSLKSLRVTKEEIQEAMDNISPKLLKSLKQAKKNIEKFHTAILCKKEPAIKIQAGVKIWREFRPIEKVGLYVPGGKAAYPSTVLMLAIPAQVAGCREVIICTPPDRKGKCNPAVLVAASICGVKKIFKVGGAQSIAAMAYGTETIPKVYKIFGPGNQYVTTAKILAYGDVDIDMPAGPSEVLIIADKSANPAWVAADLLSQLEHGEDSQAVLLTTDQDFAKKVCQEIDIQTKKLSRKSIIAKSEQVSFIVIVKNLDEAIKISNEYAPEHLEIDIKNPNTVLPKIINAGSVFLGKYTSEPLGDYASGTNHTLPTSGYAKMFPPLSTDSFGKMMQVQKVSKEGLRKLKETVETIAENEGLDAHKNAISIRFK
ncbi:histidinol dehydrogenase [Patescibacteria group bacterium]|nr:histidinol dehydrogenase [Patescibacteria group bacterium]